MTVTPLPSRPSVRRRSRVAAPSAPALTVSFDDTILIPASPLSAVTVAVMWV